MFGIIVDIPESWFTEATQYSFCKITMSHRDFGIPALIPNTHLDKFDTDSIQKIKRLNQIGIQLSKYS
jgi:hypothetical protein